MLQNPLKVGEAGMVVPAAQHMLTMHAFMKHLIAGDTPLGDCSRSLPLAQAHHADIVCIALEPCERSAPL